MLWCWIVGLREFKKAARDLTEDEKPSATKPGPEEPPKPLP